MASVDQQAVERDGSRSRAPGFAVLVLGALMLLGFIIIPPDTVIARVQGGCLSLSADSSGWHADEAFPSEWVGEVEGTFSDEVFTGPEGHMVVMEDIGFMEIDCSLG